MSWAVWRRQAWQLARAEILRSVFSRRAIAVYVLAAMPIILALLRALFVPDSVRQNISESTPEFAQIFYVFMLRFIVFFGNALLFVKLFRGEILERSLHYTLLAPVRREVLVVGKYVGGLTSAFAILGTSTALTFILIYIPHLGLGLRTVFTPTVIGHLISYLLLVGMACAAYGALFMLAGLYFRNPMVPAILFLGWESLTPFLPPFLKAFSFVNYLNSLAPVPPQLGAFALLAEPVARWKAVLGLLVAIVVLLWLSSRKAKRLEITYATE